MSILLNHSDGWILCHEKMLQAMYKDIISNKLYFNENFKIFKPFKCIKGSEDKYYKKKRKSFMLSEEASLVEKKYLSIMKMASEKIIFTKASAMNHQSNDSTRIFANTCLEEYKSIGTTIGSNTNDHPIVASINGVEYLFPASCTFINDDVSSLEKHLKHSKYGFILLDPPWCNRFVKRRKKYHSEHGYSFLDHTELNRMDIRSLLHESGLICVWTTNSPSHTEAIKELLFPSWGVEYTSTWFWIKVTQCGELIVPFSTEKIKQPYERMMFGCKPGRRIKIPEDNRCIISVPSSIHSHKPPLSEIIKDYIDKDDKCLEIFARYLLPGWTSFGNQVLSLQLKSLYTPSS